MSSRNSHSVNILETPFSTVTSSGHWFHATRDTVNKYVPGLLKKYSYEDLITKSVIWIDSADSIAMLLFFVLAFTVNPWIAIVTAPLFHYWWYHNKSAFVNIPFLTIVKLINKDLFQLLIAAVALSFMGISGMYLAVSFGILYFFLFKVSLLRRLWDKLDQSSKKDKLPLNDRVLKMVLIKYALYENMPPVEIERLENHVRQAVIDFNTKKRK